MPYLLPPHYEMSCMPGRRYLLTVADKRGDAGYQQNLSLLRLVECGWLSSTSLLNMAHVTHNCVLVRTDFTFMGI